jgi:hypothetical protein
MRFRECLPFVLIAPKVLTDQVKSVKTSRCRNIVHVCIRVIDSSSPQMVPLEARECFIDGEMELL